MKCQALNRRRSRFTASRRLSCLTRINPLSLSKKQGENIFPPCLQLIYGTGLKPLLQSILNKQKSPTLGSRSYRLKK